VPHPTNFDNYDINDLEDLIEDIEIAELKNMMEAQVKRWEENSKRNEEYLKEIMREREKQMEEVEEFLKKHLEPIESIKNVKEELIIQKSMIESLKKMIFEFLIRMENLLNNREMQNRDNSVDKPMEEVKSEPSRLGFF
jgi:DNA repair exonuclease SbcCD ATPase subunit